jgi:hypothetical protein
VQEYETESRFIARVISGDGTVRKAEDIGGQELIYAEVKAMASGNPAASTLAEADAEVQRLAILKKNHADEQYLARRNLRDLPDLIRHRTKRVVGRRRRSNSQSAIPAGSPRGRGRPGRSNMLGASTRECTSLASGSSVTWTKTG